MNCYRDPSQVDSIFNGKSSLQDAVEEARSLYRTLENEDFIVKMLENELRSQFEVMGVGLGDLDKYRSLRVILRNTREKTRRNYLAFKLKRETLEYPVSILAAIESTVGLSAKMIIRGMILLKNGLCVAAIRNGKKWNIHLTNSTIICSTWAELAVTCLEVNFTPVLAVYENSSLFKGSEEVCERTMSVNEHTRENINQLLQKTGDVYASIPTEVASNKAPPSLFLVHEENIDIRPVAKVPSLLEENASKPDDDFVVPTLKQTTGPSANKTSSSLLELSNGTL